MAFLIDIIQFHCTTEHKQVIKSSVACANLTAFSLIYEVLQCLHDVLNLFLDKAYLKMKIPAVPEETYSLFQFYSINVKVNWAHLAGQNSRLEVKITTLFKLS